MLEAQQVSAGIDGHGPARQLLDERIAGLRIDQRPIPVAVHCSQELVRNEDGQIEVMQRLPVALRLDECLDIGMIATQSPHHRTTSPAGCE